MDWPVGIDTSRTERGARNGRVDVRTYREAIRLATVNGLLSGASAQFANRRMYPTKWQFAPAPGVMLCRVGVAPAEL
jgi:hypothetical protein